MNGSGKQIRITELIINLKTNPVTRLDSQTQIEKNDFTDGLLKHLINKIQIIELVNNLRLELAFVLFITFIAFCFQYWIFKTVFSEIKSAKSSIFF